MMPLTEEQERQLAVERFNDNVRDVADAVDMALRPLKFFEKSRPKLEGEEVEAVIAACRELYAKLVPIVARYCDQGTTGRDSGSGRW